MSYLSVNEAAEALGISPERVRALLRSQTLDGQRVGGRWLVSRAAVMGRLERGPRAGRPMSAQVSRAMVDLIAQHLGAEPGPAWERLAQPHQSRLRRRWEQLVGSEEPGRLLRVWLPHRCHSQRFSFLGDPSEIFDDPRLHAGGPAHPALGLSGGSLVEPHVADADRSAVIADLLLIPAAEGDVLLRSEPVVRVDLAACLADVAELGGGRNDRIVAEVLAVEVVR